MSLFSSRHNENDNPSKQRQVLAKEAVCGLLEMVTFVYFSCSVYLLTLYQYLFQYTKCSYFVILFYQSIYSCTMYMWSINGYDIILLLYEISFSIWYDILFIWYIIFDKIWYFSIRYDIFRRNFQDFSTTTKTFLDMSSFENFCTHLCLFINDLDSESPPPTLIVWISQIHFWFSE